MGIDCCDECGLERTHAPDCPIVERRALIIDDNPSEAPHESGGSELTRLLAGGWLPMAESPKDGTSIQAHIPGHGSDNILLWVNGLLDADSNDCGGWAFAEDQEPPECWTDGVCWESNDDGKKSIEPMCWKPLSN